MKGCRGTTEEEEEAQIESGGSSGHGVEAKSHNHAPLYTGGENGTERTAVALPLASLTRNDMSVLSQPWF